MRVSRPYEETHKMIENEIYKLCIICEKWFPMTNEHFYKNKSSKRDGLNPYCKKCTIEKSKKNMDLDKQRERVKHFYRTRQRTRDLRKAVMDKRRAEGKFREWQRNNPDKIKEYARKRQHKEHEISKQEWISCKEYFNFECAYCGISDKKAKKIYNNHLHKDHVDHEGANDISNCVPACKSCNGSKHNFELKDWYNKDNPNYTQERYNKIEMWLENDYKLYIQKEGK